MRAALRNEGFGELPPLAMRAARASWVSWSKLALLAGSLIGGGGLAVMLLRPHAPSPQPAPSTITITAPERPVPPVRQPTPDEPRVETARLAVKTRATATPVAKPVRATLDDDALQRELRVVASADNLIRAHHFADALRVLGSSDNAANVLHEERTALRILAWCGQGADERALRARERFLQTSPQAVLAARVREACTGQGSR